MNTWALVLLGVLIGVAAGAPSDNSFVVSSTEPSERNGKEGNIQLHPVIYEMDITSNISNRFAKTLVVSKVKNPDKTSKETTFTVVLPEKAFISEFVMEIGGKSYKAYVKDKEEAKNIYNKAVSSGQSAGHVSVSARDSNKFTISVNIEPESKAVFLLTYEELLQRKYNQYELILNIHPGQIVKTLNIQVLISESRPLKFVKTPSLRSGNEVSKNEDKLVPSTDIKTINSTSAVVKFHPDIEQQRQFARDLGTKESEGLAGQFVVQYDVERDPHGGEILLQDGYFVHFFAPDDIQPLPKYVVFVLDTSGSMQGRKIEQLKDAMYSILNEIKEGDKLSIVEFNSYPIVWNIEKETTTRFDFSKYDDPFPELSEINLPGPTAANNKTIDKARNVIKQINADGGTYVIGGLETALYLVKSDKDKTANSKDTHQPLIIFLTDGQPNIGLYNTEDINKKVTKLNSDNNKVPIFSLSFGDGADKAFLRKLSLNNQGFSRHIYEASDASLQLQEFYKQISSPMLSNIAFKYESAVKDVTKMHFAIYFKGSELVVAGCYKDPSIRPSIKAEGFRGPIILKPIVEQPVTSLERLWAYLTVLQTLEARESADDKTELTKNALDLALKYSLVTDVSSLVVVRPNGTSVVNTEEAAVLGGEEGDIASYSAVGRHYAPMAAFHYDTITRGDSDSDGYFVAGPLGVPRHSLEDESSFEDTDTDWQPAGSLDMQSQYDPAPTSLPTSTPVPPTTGFPIGTLEQRLPWLASALNSNRTLIISQGVYELGKNSVVGTANTSCPKTPLNDTDSGFCTLLKDCPQVHSYLTDFQVYQQYFCPVDAKYAGVCCPTTAN